MSWQEIARSHREKQFDSIPKEWLLKSVPNDLNVLEVPAKCGLLTARELEITDTVDINVTLANLAQRFWSSVEVTTAYYKRAIIAHQLTNCLTEIFVDKALARAKELDEHLSRTGKVVGPLHGLPISLKDTFPVKGLPTAMGYVSWLKNVAEQDCVLVDILNKAGAVPFVRTNVPQTLMWGETYNNIFGRTVNPYNRSLTPGGSSGGESALLALRGSPLGVGTDIGGSVRIPTTWTSLYALRPSMFRFPYAGLVNSCVGQEAIQCVNGPMGPSIASLRSYAKAVVDSKPWNLDPAVHKIYWNAEEEALSGHGGLGAKLCFAVMWDSDIVKPTPPVKRALEITCKALKAAGHTVVDWETYKHAEIRENTHAIFNADGAQDFRRDCAASGEPLNLSLVPDYQSEHKTYGYMFGAVPPPTGADGKPVHIEFQGNPLGWPAPKKNGEEEAPIQQKTAWELWGLHARRRELQKEYLDHWEATKSKTGTGRPVDAIIAPVAAYPAPPHGHNSDAFYTSLWNGLDYSACSFPVTFVDPVLDAPVPRTEFHGRDDEHIYRWYNPHVVKGSPIGLQLVGRTHEEEAVLTMTSIVVDALASARGQ